MKIVKNYRLDTSPQSSLVRRGNKTCSFSSIGEGWDEVGKNK